MENLKELIRKIVKENTESNFVLSEEDFTADLKMIKINSIQFIKIIVEIENELDIEFEDEEIAVENYTTLNDFIECIKKKLGENK